MNRGNHCRFAGFHPAAIFLYLCAVLAFSMLFFSPLCLAVTLLGSVSFCLILYPAEKILKTALVFLSLVAVTALISGAFQHRGLTVLFLLPNGNAVTLESILYGIASGVMLISVLGWFACLNVVFPGEKWVYLFGKALPSLALVLSMILRLVPRFLRQAGEIRKAQQGLCRPEEQKLFLKIRQGGHTFSILISWALENAIVTADSMKSRGYGLPGRTAFSRYRFTLEDGCLMAETLGMSALTALCAIKGGFAYSYYPTADGLTVTPMGIIGLCAYGALCMLPTLITVGEEWKWKHLRSKA